MQTSRRHDHLWSDSYGSHDLGHVVDGGDASTAARGGDLRVACHEGNDPLTDMLSIARFEENAAKDVTSPAGVKTQSWSLSSTLLDPWL